MYWNKRIATCATNVSSTDISISISIGISRSSISSSSGGVTVWYGWHLLQL